jgi:hypothetical protein
VTFAESAKNRESVMCLGSIAHLQYYFARTGLLDGKGGQMAKTKQNGEYDIPRLSLSGSEVVDSPIEEEGQLLWEAAKEDGDTVMLPPTVSTYSHREPYIPPPPDQKSLKKDLVEALEVALRAIEDTVPSKNSVSKEADEDEPSQGFYEIQGLHILDTTTLAIRAARLYYTMHPNPALLNSIKSDYQLRRDLMTVLDVLKRWAGRKFTGGLREEERLAILVWVSEVGMMIDEETKLEDAERQEREGWKWMDDTEWDDKDELRELSFLESLLHDTGSDTGPLPQWTPSGLDHVQTEFLKSLADGRQLVQMHNAAVKRSKKQFGQITSHHADIVKPYRRADNLRFWIKAAEIRWETKLNVDVMAVVNSAPDPQVWKAFEDAIFRWSKAAREEVTRDWKTDEERKLHARAKSLALASPANSPKNKSAEFRPESPLAA